MNNKTYISLDIYISKIYNPKKGTMWIIGHTFFLNIFILDVFYNEKEKFASKLLYDVLYITINRKTQQVKTHNYCKFVKI